MKLVTFNAKMTEALLAQQAFYPETQAQLKAELSAGFIVTGEPRPGRINVTIMRKGLPNYRTFAARDLVEIPA